MILDNHRITIRVVVVGMSFNSCQAIFADVLGKTHATAKIDPKLLNFERKQCHLDSAQKTLTTFNDDPGLLKKAIFDDESWLYSYEIETKVQSSQ